MNDLFGQKEQRPDFVDIPATRPGVADEKAQLVLILNRLCKVPPKSLGSASVNVVRRWREAHKAAFKILNAKNSSRQELQSAINNMQSYE